jgi:hydrogenase maturation protease
MKRIAVVGLGNVLMADDGVGVRVAEKLEKEKCLPPNVTLVQGETGGISLLPHLDGVNAIILVDAVDFEGEFGETRIFPDDEIWTDCSSRVSMHDVGLQDLVSLLKFQSDHDLKLTLVGIKPKIVFESLEMSAQVRKAVNDASNVVVELAKALSNDTD